MEAAPADPHRVDSCVLVILAVPRSHTHRVQLGLVACVFVGLVLKSLKRTGAHWLDFWAPVEQLAVNSHLCSKWYLQYIFKIRHTDGNMNSLYEYKI